MATSHKVESFDFEAAEPGAEQDSHTPEQHLNLTILCDLADRKAPIAEIRVYTDPRAAHISHCEKCQNALGFYKISF